MSTDYTPPVATLLTLGDCRKRVTWLDYLAYGLTSSDVPELIRLTLDEDLRWADSDSDEVWAGIHAWRPGSIAGGGGH